MPSLNRFIAVNQTERGPLPGRAASTCLIDETENPEHWNTEIKGIFPGRNLMKRNFGIAPGVSTREEKSALNPLSTAPGQRR